MDSTAKGNSKTIEVDGALELTPHQAQPNRIQEELRSRPWFQSKVLTIDGASFNEAK